jgi:hypothetical protein
MAVVDEGSAVTDWKGQGTERYERRRERSERKNAGGWGGLRNLKGSVACADRLTALRRSPCCLSTHTIVRPSWLAWRRRSHAQQRRGRIALQRQRPADLRFCTGSPFSRSHVAAAPLVVPATHLPIVPGTWPRPRAATRRGSPLEKRKGRVKVKE